MIETTMGSTKIVTKIWTTIECGTRCWLKFRRGETQQRRRYP